MVRCTDMNGIGLLFLQQGIDIAIAGRWRQGQVRGSFLPEISHCGGGLRIGICQAGQLDPAESGQRADMHRGDRSTSCDSRAPGQRRRIFQLYHF